jgi:tRNA (guanine26-N2/guanine27-N2)-dimethyltransferase
LGDIVLKRWIFRGSHLRQCMHIISEGGVEIGVPSVSENGRTKDVFFNSHMELNRDITIAVLRCYKNEDLNSYLDATAATGVRGVRAAADGWEVSLIDRDASAVELCRHNLDINNQNGEVFQGDANIELRRRKYDVVDIDPFGSPIGFLDSALRGVKKLLCITATDTAPLCGAHFQAGVRRYNAIPRKTEYHAEVGMRILLSTISRMAAQYDIGTLPVLSHATRHYFRVYVEIEKKVKMANESLSKLGYIHHCQSCLYREVSNGMIASPPPICPECRKNKIITTGPVWLGDICEKDFIDSVLGNITEEMGTKEKSLNLLLKLKGELSTSTHYDQHKLCKLWGRSVEKMDVFMGRLENSGFEVSRTHYGGTTLKTNATVSEMFETTR